MKVESEAFSGRLRKLRNVFLIVLMLSGSGGAVWWMMAESNVSGFKNMTPTLTKTPTSTPGGSRPEINQLTQTPPLKNISGITSLP